ncbi:tRNA splicing endonuclease subunit sen2 [Cadophora gregata]|uniref:tRNA splicing endonuclease subunit sen2 n=1 Tax=Cadophora gregata TaxID=51156 RepID=UPI0026DC9A92|nr:tRNA splicing endonuclease subunit sen2 [Cadophora gregata]KAK0103071.1 tRNA splicing endonuclease subunit sen2 [Cadophora gregata f. sp. sojae]KAK0128802.1 tRNA splicing endonuclease subunit sen2 [Cadophora gregata]
MADTKQMRPADKGKESKVTPPTSKPRVPSRFEQLNKLYALPAPLRTFPLPTFVPHNPLSLFHILYVWLSQTVHPEQSHISPAYQGWFSPETRSVHVTDIRSIRGLWEQGFYGKGNLSRSEPSWLSREKTRLGTKTKITSEEVTRQRRAERQVTKWERARKEREAIDQTLQEEAAAEQPEETPIAPLDALPLEAPAEPQFAPPEQVLAEEEIFSANSSYQLVAPVAPLELLALPNSLADLESLLWNNTVECFVEDFDGKFVQRFHAPSIGPLELLALPNSIESFLSNIPTSLKTPSTSDLTKSATTGQLDRPEVSLPASDIPAEDQPNALKLNGHLHLEEVELVGGSETNDETVDGSVHSEQTTETNDTGGGSTPVNGIPSTPKMKRRKSVRFSPTVEKNTFIQTEPPSPEKAATNTTTIEEARLVIKNQEHVQLTLEEAFFLSYALGSLTVLDPNTNAPISNEDLFYLARKTSYFPPQANPSLSPDDPFMINYVVYHHFRSLGWVLRSGTKFSVDYMLYTRGPVFTHAEFAILVLPSYTDPYWRSNPFLENYVKGKEQRTWAWLSCINRVITQVKKTLILTYVDVPKPVDVQEERELGIDGVLRRYKVREVVMKRFSANRMRD